MQSFVSKARRPEFELHLRIIDLNNVPLVSGTSFIKWNLPSSTAAEHRGRTPKSTIKNHEVVYDYEKVIPVRLTIGKDQMLQETLVHFEILQEYSSGGKGERITLGILDLNLSEYVDGSQGHNGSSGEEGPSGVSRRYLMQQSKINSTLKIDIAMKQVRGDKNFIVPPLRTAPVFGGIAGIMSYEADAADETNYMQNLPGRSRETGERQDLYRFVLAAAWAAAPNQLKADECIEDIFAGGNGWGRKTREANGETKNPTLRSAFGSADKSARNSFSGSNDTSNNTANISNFFRRSEKGSARDGVKRQYATGESSSNQGAVSGRSGLDQEAGKLGLSKRTNDRQLQQNEVDEFDGGYREDLRSWKISNTAATR